MAETPRSAKRRRLNNDTFRAQSSPTPKSSARQSSRKSSRKSLAKEVDIYDDFEGALEGSARRGIRGRIAIDEGGSLKKSAKSGRKSKTQEEVDVLEEDEMAPVARPLFSSLPNGVPPRNVRSRARGKISEMLASEEASSDRGDDEPGNQDSELSGHVDDATAFDAQQQLLVEAAASVSPSKRRKSSKKSTSRAKAIETEYSEKSQAEEERGHLSARRKRPKSNDTTPISDKDITDLDVDSDVEITPLEISTESISIESPQLSLLKSIALSKLSQRRPIPLTNLSTEYTKVHTLLTATIQSGESNSLLLIGARGSGKTTLINACLHDLSRSSKETFHVVRLNGFVQTDDKLALREIWRQLGREMEVDEDENAGPGKSYADTLAMLLALLSHPDEIAGQEVEGVAKSIIFIMDEFDLFATHPRQTLLYNLLDIAQSRKAPIAVLGLTTRIDVTEALEKRVKSRFSHRFVHLPLPKGLGGFVEVGKAALGITAEELSFEEKSVLTKESGSKPKKGGSEKAFLLKEWNDGVDLLFSNDKFLKHHIHSIYHTTKSIPTLLSALLLPTSALTTYPHPSSFTTPSNTLTAPDSLLSLLPSLSDLSLSLLIAACRLSIIHSTESLNFALAYGEYVSLASKARINSAAAGQMAAGSATRLFGKAVARKEWERVGPMGVVGPAGAGGFGVRMGRGGMAGEMCRVDVALEEIPGGVVMGGGSLSQVMDKWCRQI